MATGTADDTPPLGERRVPWVPRPDEPDGRPHRTFAFSADGAHFLLDGEPFQIRSGELHPARIPVEYWQHRIRMVRAMGLNCIALYVMWNYHETQPGVFDFETGNRDIEAFIRLCQRERMWVLLRPGPYVCAEWDLGGLPWWLLRYPDIVLRTGSAGDARYMAAVARYVAELAARVKPLMMAAGGPILMVQIENEFGSYAHNPPYLEEIRALWLQGGITGPFYTEDGLMQLQQNRSHVEGGAIALSNGDAAQIAAARAAFPGVPVMAGEVYPGWLTHWGDAAFQGTAVDIGEKLDAFMRERLSFNLYVIHGGTSFAFYAGANIDDRTGAYQPDITSYDYAAPINEQGAATPKYAKYREIIARYLPSPLPEVPPPLPTIERLARAALVPAACASIWDNLPEALPAGDTIDPQPFEMDGQAFGFALYRTTLPAEAMQADSRLETGGVHDYATVFVDGEYVGGISRARMPAHSAKRYGVANETEAPLMLPATAGTQNATRQAQRSSTQLDILVEGMGRVNYGHAMVDRKGMPGPVTLRYANGKGETLRGWEVFLLPMDDAFIAALRPVCTHPHRPGVFFKATLMLDEIGDTYLDMRHWTKGVVWVNGHNLGRYWHIGPQTRLYCPAPWLVRGANNVLIFDLHQTEARPVELVRTLS